MSFSDGHVDIRGVVQNDGSLSGRGGGVDVYFVARINAPADVSQVKLGTWVDGALSSAQVAESRNGSAGAFVSFAGPVDAIEIKVAISFISLELVALFRFESNSRVQAEANYAAEVANVSFERAIASAAESWEAVLSKLEFGDAMPEDMKVKLATAMVHTHLAPSQFSEVLSFCARPDAQAGGLYLGMDKAVHHVAENHKYYTDMSIWFATSKAL